jgi:transcription initiation factor TFIIE subunit alpha
MPKKDNIVDLMLTKEFLNVVGGEHALNLVRICLTSKKDVTDEEIGKKLPLKVTEIRAILNRLHYRGIASYNKKKNSKSGWYHYTWKMSPNRIAELILEQQEEVMEKEMRSINLHEEYTLFGCQKGCQKQPFEIAIEYQFKCPDCGESMEAIDAKKHLKNAQKQMEQIQEEMKILQKIKE